MDTADSINQEAFELLRTGQPVEALEVLELGLERWPNNRRLQLTKGEILAQSDRHSDAASHYAGLLADSQSAPWAAKRLAGVLDEERLDLEQARDVGARVAAADLAPAAKHELVTRLLEREDEAEVLALLAEIAPKAGLFRYEWRLAVHLTERGDFEGALRLLEAAHIEGRTSELAQTLYADLLATCGRLDDGITILEEILVEHPDRPDPYRRLVALLQRARDFDRAGDVMDMAAQRWPKDWMLVLRLNRLPIAGPALDRIFARLCEAADEAKMDDRYRLQFALACMHAGDFDRASALLERPFVKPVDQMALPVTRVFRSRPADFWRTRTRLEDDRTLDVQITRAKSARATVVVPTGVAFGYIPPAMIDALFAEHGVNAIFLRDFRKRGYLRGVVSLGADEAETIVSLRRLLADLGAPKTIVMGCSLGGFVAIRYAILLGADAAVSYSGPTKLDAVYADAKPSIWNPAYFTHQLLVRETDLPKDLLSILPAPDGPVIRQMYGADCAEDVVQAQRIAGLPGISVEAVAGVGDHLSVAHMIADGSFDQQIEDLLKDA